VLGRLKGGMSVSRDHFFRYIPLLENIRREFRIRKTAPTIQSLIALSKERALGRFNNERHSVQIQPKKRI
jgi:hypothetical protein